MTAIRVDNSLLIKAETSAILLAAALSITMLASTVTVNQALAIFFTFLVATIFAFDKHAGMIAGVIFFAVKAVFVRIAFSIDLSLGRSGFDLLGIAPALLLAAMVGGTLMLDYIGGKKICVDRTRTLMMLFTGVCFLSIFNPSSTPLIGLAGFERNVMPNMLIIFLASAVVTSQRKLDTLLKSLLILGAVSTLYAIGQYLMALYPWEMDWYRKLASDQGLSGWLTIGLRGIEFRVFSIFYGYMDFFFSNVIIFGLVLAYGERLTGKWRKLRVLYFCFWLTILGLTVERMPFIMSLIILAVYAYLKADQARRKRIIVRGGLALAALYLSLVIAKPVLESTGAANLIRLAELANPFSASSINDRIENKWGPSIETIKANPLGVGIGYGSQTKARDQAETGGYFIQPHNEIIQKILETGFLGGFLYLLLLAYTYRDFLFISNIDFAGYSFGTGMAAVTISFWLCGMVNLPFSGTSGLIYWTLSGAALGIKGNIVSVCNKAKPLLHNADIVEGRLVQDATNNSATANMDVLQQKIK